MLEMISVDISVIGGLVVAAVALLTFWMALASRITSAQVRADEAEKLAIAATASAKEANEKTTLLSASFGIYREQIARDYIHREVMREVEDRLTAAIERLGDRMDRVLERAGHHISDLTHSA